MMSSSSAAAAAAIAAAASLLKRRPSLSVAIVEPAEVHYYQPGFTLVGAGVFKPEVTKRPMASVIPDKAVWIKKSVAEFAPESDEVVLDDGSRLRYRALIASPGIKLDWDAIQGLVETLGRNGVTSNYRYDLAPYTLSSRRTLRGGRALFTQPPMPIKCAGAPQKAMYLSCEHWRRAGALANMEVEFHNAGAVLFGVPAYVPALMEYVKRYGIDLRLESKLVAVDGPAKIATFEQKEPDGVVTRVQRDFAMMHAVPPQRAPDFVAREPAGRREPASSPSIRRRCATRATPMSSRSATRSRRPTPRRPPPRASRRRSSPSMCSPCSTARRRMSAMTAMAPVRSRWSAARSCSPSSAMAASCCRASPNG